MPQGITWHRRRLSGWRDGDLPVHYRVPVVITVPRDHSIHFGDSSVAQRQMPRPGQAIGILDGHLIFERVPVNTPHALEKVCAFTQTRRRPNHHGSCLALHGVYDEDVSFPMSD